jgi:hypothetical protein
VLALFITCVVLLPIVGLAFYALHRKSGRLKVSASVLKLLTFTVEVEPQDRQHAPELTSGGKPEQPSSLAGSPGDAP